MLSEHHSELVLSLGCVICDRDRREKVLEVLETQKSHFNLGSLGKGTANSKILGYLGLGETEKAVFFTIMPAPIARQTLDKLDKALHLDKPGHGIAFTTRIHERCYHKPVAFEGKDTDGGTEVEQTQAFDLIMVVLNRGYTEEVMDVARRAGARGGTVLHARGCGLSGAEKFFGVTIQPEKEMIMIVADNTNSCPIMQAIADSNGPGSDAGAVSFSMPLSGVHGIAQPMEKPAQ